MKSIVITGSTRGIGYGLADAFLERECSVTVSGRKAEGVARACQSLGKKHPAEHILGVPCDVRAADQTQSLWDDSVTRFGKVDIWINNAGVSGPQLKVWKYTPTQVGEVVETNLLGLIYGSQVATRGMLQQGFGGIYNMEGMGSDGRMHDGLALYGMTKYGMSYFTKSLVRETHDSSIVVGSIRPGMVITDMIEEQYIDRPEEWERVKRIFNIIANRIEEVAPWIAERVLQNSKSGVCFSYMTRVKYLQRFLLSPFSRRELFDDPQSA